MPLESRFFNARRVVAVVVVLVVGGLAACAVNPASKRPELVTMSESKEIELGATMHGEILKAQGAYPDPELQEYVSAIGNRLADLSDRSSLEWTFTVVDTEDINAFAVPGGYIYITRGLLAHLNSEAQLAAVLGHEIAHVTARHTVQSTTQANVASVLGAIANAVTGLPVNIVTDYLSGAVISGYGRERELEADRLGAVYMSRVGYDTDQMLQVLSSLKDQELFEIERAEAEGREPRVYHGLFSTHPRHDARLQQVVKQAARINANAELLPNGEQTFLDKIDGLSFGRLAAGGVFVEGQFRHAGYGVGLRVPRAWRVESRGGRLIMASPYKDNVVVLTVRKISPGTRPRDVIVEKLGVKNPLEEERFRVRGLDGHSALSARSQSPFGERPVRFTVITDKELAYVFAAAANTTEAAKRDRWRSKILMRSLEVLDANDRTAKVPVVRVVQANSATTMERLAAASPLTEYAEQRLRLLNHLYPDGEPTVGSAIKVID